ncbi:hypothetical protein P154DRAFT_145045 [Amniculicola lignicola CBS 123094]|uniref:DUF8035 domain-containing protein n=1 Tax=Amniculicola lignicola CBS 123094 TaxID=1392246 RepID=A0A6A5WQ15_9PLEO|nr:hypothetical protein P154DRAFT_145045 [Amniculicola lignicola CBS 123094]
MYRSSTGDLSFHDDPPVRGGAQRWDRDRFERMRGGGGGGGGGGGSVHGGNEHEHYRFQERDRFPGGRRDIDFHEDIDRRPTRVVERDCFHEDDHSDRPARRRPHELFEERAEVANLALAPYRRKSVVEKDIDIAVRRPQRPGYIRRQSSLDTFDRRPAPRFTEIERIDRFDVRDRERDEWRPPMNTPIPLPLRERRRSPSRRRFREDEFEEELRIREIERERERERERGRGREEEEYREVEIKREKSKRRRSRSRAAKSIAATSVRSSSTSSFEEVKTVSGRRGKTRMPKRLVKKQAVIELGYPFEEEDDFIIIKRALEKDHIDEIIKVSENYKEVEKTTYVYEDTAEVVHVPPPPPPPPVFMAPPPPPPPATIIHEHHTVHAPSVRGHSPSRHTVYEERIEESNHIGGPLNVLVPEERRTVFRDTHESRELVIPEGRHLSRSERDIKDEIRRLEDERRMLKYERETDYEFVERREPRREVVRVEKDRKARPKPKLVAAMLATLS